MKKKVVIIGAGPAGLSAGYELLDKSKKYDVLILEESDSIGGISRTVNYKGNRMDIGGHRFFSKDPKVVDFWNKIMPLQGSPSFDDKKLGREKNIAEVGPDPEKEDRVMLVRNRISRIYYLKKFFDYPISFKLQTFTNMGLGRTIKSGTSYIKSMIVKKEESSLENFYINRFGKQLYSMFFEKYTEKLWGRHPSEISADWGSQRVKGLSIMAVIKDMLHINKKKETSLIEEYVYPKYGPGQLWETVASEIEKMGGTIKKNHSVKKINVKGNKIVSVTANVGGKDVEIKGDIFISSMPLKDLVLDIDAKIPKKVKEIAKGLPYRDFVTIGLLVNKLNLKNTTKIKTLNNIVPDCWIYVQEPDVKLGRIQVFNNWSPYMVEKPEETVWIGLEYFCNEGDEFWNMSDSECIKFATDELIHMGIIDEEDVLDAHREKVKKAYPAYFDTYENIDEVIKYVNKYDNLYCVGRNGQHRYNNMDHSMITGFEAASNIMTGRKDKENVWSVNTEKEYHESKEDNHDKKDKPKKEEKKKKKINSLIPVTLIVLFELLIYFITPYIKHNNEFIISLIILSSVGYIMYCKDKDDFNIRSFTCYLMIIGVLVRTLYMLKTNIYIRQHDVETLDSNGHLAYIYELFKLGKLPFRNDWQFYQPPLFHILGALWLKFNNLIGIKMDRALEGIQVLTVIFSSITMIYAYKIVDKIKIGDKYKLLINSFMIFYPTFIILSGSINNDCLLVMLEFAIIYHLINWYENSNWLNTIILAIVTGLCVMTKLNGAIMAVPILYIFIKKFIESFKYDKDKLPSIFKKIVIFGIISLTIGLWFQVRGYILFDKAEVPEPSDFTKVSSYTIKDRFISLDYKSLLKNPYCYIPGEYNIYTYLIKSSIFGEYNFNFNGMYAIMYLLVNFILIILSTIYIFKYIFSKKNVILNVLLFTWLINIISFYLFNIKYPFFCSMDYRYIVPTVLTGIVLLVYGSSKSNKYVNLFINCSICIFTILSILFTFLIK